MPQSLSKLAVPAHFPTIQQRFEYGVAMATVAFLGLQGHIQLYKGDPTDTSMFAFSNGLYGIRRVGVGTDTTDIVDMYRINY